MTFRIELYGVDQEKKRESAGGTGKKGWQREEWDDLRVLERRVSEEEKGRFRVGKVSLSSLLFGISLAMCPSPSLLCSPRLSTLISELHHSACALCPIAAEL